MTKMLLQAHSEILEKPTPTNPLRTVARFVLLDDQPDGNNRVVEYSEFQNIIDTAIGMPVKMNFTGDDVENHAGSLPIGTITNVEVVTLSDDHHQLVAEATLWTDEFPREISWLKRKYAEGKAPGISYELVYSSAEHEGLVEKIRNVITGAATFVKTPAFGNRTPLIALASFKEDAEAFMKNVTPEERDELIALAEQLKQPEPTAEGGNEMDEKELEALKAKAELAERLTAEAASKDQMITDLQSQLTAKDTELTGLNERITSMEQAALLDSRVRQYTEAGFTLEAEAAEKKKTLFASLSDDQFKEYLEDLVATREAAKAAAPKDNTALASFRALAEQGSVLPRVEVEPEQGFASLKQTMRGLARPNSVE